MPYQEYDFVIKKGDTGPPLMVQCIDSNGTPVDLTGSSNLTFRMRNKRTGIIETSAVAEYLEIANGKVQYSWTTNDTDNADEYEGEFNVTLSNGQVISFPNNTYIKINIYESVTA